MKKQRLWLLPLLAAILIFCIACGGSEKDPQVDYNPRTGEVTGTASPAPVESEIISIVTPEPDLHRDELDAILKRTTMLDGITVEGVSVGGMTLEEARAAVLPVIDAKRKALKVDVTLDGASVPFSGEVIAVTDNLDEMLNEAFGLVREDNGFETVSAAVEEIRTSGRDFPVLLTFEETALRKAVDAYAEEHDTLPVNATVAYNQKANKIDFTPEVTGKHVDREALVSALLEAKSGDSVAAPVAETPAEVTLDDVKAKYVLRSTYTTKFSKSIKNRKFNICKGAGMITGTVLHPGDTFSANGTLGIRNKPNGWKVATAYVQGAHEKQYGGGVCQLSSTLYNAAVLADMKIVDRRNHSMPVDYVDKGRDATINSVGNPIDFKFQNSSKADVIIIAYVDRPDDYTKAGVLTMEIWGIPISEDSDGAYDEIRIPTPKKTKTLKPSKDVEYQLDETKPVGYKELLVKNQNGSVWESTKEYYLKGKLVKTENLAKSTYKAYAAVYIIGPTPVPTATASATPKPTDSNTPKPTDHSDETPKPTDQSQDTPKPTDPPTPKPTDPPTPKPTDPPTPKPTDPPTPKPDNGGEGGGD